MGESLQEITYISFDESIVLTPTEAKELNIHFYNSLTSFRGLLRDISSADKGHIFKTILESNSTYFIVEYDIADMDSTMVFGKVDLIKILINQKFEYGINYTDYDDYLLALWIEFEEPVHEFRNSKEINIIISFNDMEQLVKGIKLDDTMKENWDRIKHWWKQKEKFKKFD